MIHDQLRIIKSADNILVCIFKPHSYDKINCRG